MEILNYINYLAVLVSGFVYTLLGALWYSPFLFSKDYAEACKISEACKTSDPHSASEVCKASSETKECCGCGSSLFWSFLNSLLVALGLAVLITMTGAFTAFHGATVAFWSWLGFVATTLLSAVIWEKKSWQWWLITAGFPLVGLLAIGAILGAWR